MLVRVKIKYNNGPNGMKGMLATVQVLAPSKTESAVMAAIKKAHPGYIDVVVLQIL